MYSLMLIASRWQVFAVINATTCKENVSFELFASMVLQHRTKNASMHATTKCRYDLLQIGKNSDDQK